jgi:triosephosphate isomerase
VGEVLQEREAGMTDDVLRRQCVRAFHAVSAKKAAKLVVAYEPVWAIGTGKTATPELAAEAHAVIRREATEVFGEEFASKLRILYGGSVKPENAATLMAQEEIDGALVGGGVARGEVVCGDCEVLSQFRMNVACSWPGPRQARNVSLIGLLAVPLAVRAG